MVFFDFLTLCNKSFKCKKLTNLRTHQLISIDFFDRNSLNFIIQTIRNLQKNTNCHGALVSPFTFLNFLYHHSTGRLSLDCIGRIVDRSNSVCLSQFLKNTRRLSGKKNDVGSDMLTAHSVEKPQKHGSFSKKKIFFAKIVIKIWPATRSKPV